MMFFNNSGAKRTSANVETEKNKEKQKWNMHLVNLTTWLRNRAWFCAVPLQPGYLLLSFSEVVISLRPIVAICSHTTVLKIYGQIHRYKDHSYRVFPAVLFRNERLGCRAWRAFQMRTLFVVYSYARKENWVSYWLCLHMMHLLDSVIRGWVRNYTPFSSCDTLSILGNFSPPITLNSMEDFPPMRW